MIIGFVIWSIVAVIFLGIGVACRRADNAMGFFTFIKPPVVTDVKQYNKTVSILWLSLIHICLLCHSATGARQCRYRQCQQKGCFLVFHTISPFVFPLPGPGQGSPAYTDSIEKGLPTADL